MGIFLLAKATTFNQTAESALTIVGYVHYNGMGDWLSQVCSEVGGLGEQWCRENKWIIMLFTIGTQNKIFSAPIEVVKISGISSAEFARLHNRKLD